MSKLNISIQIPSRWVGPIHIINDEFESKLMVPMATFETPLWPSTDRGARATSLAGGIQTVLIDDRMSRSILLEAPDAREAWSILQDLLSRSSEIETVISKGSRFAKFKNLNHQLVGNLIYLRIEITSGDASGHNMVTNAAESVMNWALTTYPKLQYVSISANYCTDKKVSAVNGVLGRGKAVIAETLISPDICHKILRTTPQKLVDLHIKKNLLGGLLAGSIRSANAHFANMLLAIYLATGQDAANIIEGSQGIVHAEVRPEGLYFSVTLNNLIVGTIGNGKDLDFAEENLAEMGCLNPNAEPGANSRRLAIIIASAVLCGELSLLAAQTNPGELMRSHIAIERRKQFPETGEKNA